VFTHFCEIEWLRKVAVSKQKLLSWKFVEKAAEEVTGVGEADGEQFADFMDLPEDFKKTGMQMPFPAMFPPMGMPGLLLPPSFPPNPAFLTRSE
jgi:hypothetical protein